MIPDDLGVESKNESEMIRDYSYVIHITSIFLIEDSYI